MRRILQTSRVQTRSYWKEKIKTGRPAKWDIPGEVTAEWTEPEKKRLLDLLNRMPEELKATPFDGFYRMKKSVDPINPATTADDGKSIAIYDRAFANPFFSTSRVIAHELGHVIYLSFTESERRNYGIAMKWPMSRNGLLSRPGGFISSRAKDSVDEDFAENIDAFLFESDKLKDVVPTAYQWISRKFSKKFFLKMGCEDAEK